MLSPFCTIFSYLKTCPAAIAAAQAWESFQIIQAFRESARAQGRQVIQAFRKSARAQGHHAPYTPLRQAAAKETAKVYDHSSTQFSRIDPLSPLSSQEMGTTRVKRAAQWIQGPRADKA